MNGERDGLAGCGPAAAGLGGFALGAATVLLIVWATLRPDSRQGAPEPEPAGHVAPSLPALPPPPDLRRRDLLLPVQGVRREELLDSFDHPRGGGGRVHEALDVMAPRGTPVVAADSGRIAKLFTSRQGGLTIYQFDPTATYAYSYAHLDRYAPGLAEGAQVRRGQLLGYVGSTGNAGEDSPHLHFAIFRLAPEKRWWQGTPVNPFPLFRDEFAATAPPGR